MFSINDYVVYQYWVCQVIDIKKLDYSEMGFKKDVTYYILRSLYEKETFYIPITNTDSVRKPLNKDDAISLIDSMPYLQTIEKLNDDEYRSVIHNYDCNSYARIVKSIYRKNKYNSSIGKKLSNADSKYLHIAEKYLYDELAFALNISAKDVDQYIKDRIETQSSETA
ncbi:MAG: CarD family transcriptional regulator [Ruminococcus sp.]|nr:CarD family transcriptional regulator [Ruminococcus sp.]MCD7801173.1 CarD family transcriptional regulator [Ruminococcus sp.]